MTSEAQGGNDVKEQRAPGASSIDDSEYWEGIYSSRERYTEEKVTEEGNNGEDEFVKSVLNAASGKRVLDVGCGLGDIAIRMGATADEVVGIDVSQVALTRARKKLADSRLANVRFQLADAKDIPFPDEAFDVVISRRGPVTESVRTLGEAYKVLKKGGLLMEITIGERDKHNLAQIFGRGQMYHVKEKVTVSKTKMLRKAGFEVVEAKDYIATEIFQTLDDLLNRLKSAPIIPDFDIHRDRRHLERVGKELKTHRGIETEIHRVVLLARK